MALNNRMKEVQKAALSDEKHTIQLLQRIYEQAAKDTEAKIAELNARTDLQNIQSIVYQKQYQEALKKQLDGIINDLHTQSFTTVSEYLGKSYEHGFYGTLYDLHGQGVPFLFPIRQDEVVKALNNDYSNIAKNQRGKDIYKRMGENTDYLKKAVRAEVSRGIANGSSWLDMASHVANGMNSPFNRAMKRAFLITRTEGHRIQNQATVDVQKRAKGLGADIVKQWDATLDANTRPWHADADGQIREIDEEFDVGGEKMKAPGIGGSARNVCNCRCVLLQRAKWALNKNETKYLGDVSSMTDKQKEDIAKKLGVSVDDLPNISKSIVPIHSTDYDDFKVQCKTYSGNPDCELAKKCGEKYYKAIRDKIQSCSDEDCVGMWNQYETRIGVGDSSYKYNAQCSGTQIFINAEKDYKGCDYQAPMQVTFHESGHAIDRLARDLETKNNDVWAFHFSSAYEDGKFPKTIKDEVQDWVNSVGEGIKKDLKEHGADGEWCHDHGYMTDWYYEYYYKPNPEAFQPVKYRKSMAYAAVEKSITDMGRDKMRVWGNVSDILEGATNAAIQCGVGHGKRYWTKKGADGLATEAFAEMTDATFANEDSLNLIKEKLPKSYEVYKEMVRFIVKNTKG